MPFTPRANRAFLGPRRPIPRRRSGIRQFLDVGTDIPTAGNTHQAAQAIAPETRVVYVDYDPVVLAQAAQLLDFTQPVAVTLLAILHVIPDTDDPHAIVAALMTPSLPGITAEVNEAICEARSAPGTDVSCAPDGAFRDLRRRDLIQPA